jgi:hypothetical protein
MATFRDAQPAAPPAPAPDEAKQQIATVQADPSHPYWDQFAVGHDQAVEDIRRLHEAAFPEGAEAPPPGYDHIPVPLGQELNPAEVDEFRAEAQKLGVPVWEADVWLGRLIGPAPQTPPPTREIGEAVLGRQWGDDYKENVALARAFRDRLPEEIRERLLERFGNDPGTIIRCCELERALRGRSGG